MHACMEKTIAFGFGLGAASASLTEVLRVCEVVEVHAVGVGGDEDVGADGAVEAAHHVHHLRVEEVHGARQLRRALAVLAVQRQLGRDAPQRPRPRHDHAPRAQLVQPLHTNACSTARSVAATHVAAVPGANHTAPMSMCSLLLDIHAKSRRLSLSVRRCMHGMVLGSLWWSLARERMVDGNLIYREDLPVLGDDEADVVRECVLARPHGHGHQVVVVHEVVAAERDEHEGLVHELRRLRLADEGSQLPLVLPEVLQLVADPDDVHLLSTHGRTSEFGATVYVCVSVCDRACSETMSS
uniref:Uncharacterized protein n=1 Tax=Zea mays TaxID=4577 RepID=C0PLZ9_MAIZE|nr:unknown [Zea mays]